MYFIKDDPLNVTNQVRALVQHGAQDLRGHDKTGRLRIDLDIARQKADVFESDFEIAVLLIRERFDRRCVNSTRHVFRGQRDSILRNNRLAG